MIRKKRYRDNETRINSIDVWSSKMKTSDIPHKDSKLRVYDNLLTMFKDEFENRFY